MGRLFKNLIWLCYVLSLVLLVTASTEQSQQADGNELTISNFKLAVTTKESNKKFYKSVDYPSSLEEPIPLSQGDDLKMIFIIQDKQTEKGFLPHQTFAVLTSEKTGDQITLIVHVRDNGKSKFELDMNSAPKELTSPGNYSFDLIIGTFSHNHPIKYHIGTIEIDVPSSPPKPTSVVYGPKPEISHIFRPDEKLPPIWLSSAFVLIVLTPWIFLIGAWMHLRVNVSLITKMPSFPLSSLLFLSSIIAIEFLFYKYWTCLNIFQTLSFLTGLGILTFFTGKRALSSVQESRILGIR
ncbi:7308_t:CDS:2 [Acaulospora morrowiae]|uniref:Ribophorin II n=1 Tax=Acaulospora morrowiae TaxID=94023 RepID=A0A9N9BB03_9GLOM|nr:7308_t:CDS:2 [Acaulospora morrowiae]